MELVVRDGRFTLASDQGQDEGGDDSGPKPSELLFSSVASCFAMAVAWTARKRRVELPDLEVVVTWGDDLAERTYDHIEVEATSSLATTAPDQFETLVRLAGDVCWVTRTMRGGVPISIRAVARTEGSA